MQEEPDTIEDVYEPYLLQRGFLKRTPARALRDRRTRSATSGSSRPPSDSSAVLIASLYAAGYPSQSDGAPLHLPELR